MFSLINTSYIHYIKLVNNVTAPPIKNVRKHFQNLSTPNHLNIIKIYINLIIPCFKKRVIGETLEKK